MLAKNYRIVQSSRGYSIFEVFYDSRGQVVQRSKEPVINCFVDTACGVTDWLEAISLAAEKPSLTIQDMPNAALSIDAPDDDVKNVSG